MAEHYEARTMNLFIRTYWYSCVLQYELFATIVQIDISKMHNEIRDDW